MGLIIVCGFFLRFIISFPCFYLFTSEAASWEGGYGQVARLVKLCNLPLRYRTRKLCRVIEVRVGGTRCLAKRINCSHALA
jgi:hypothetical protein